MAGGEDVTTPRPQKSDLGVRTLSAVVMLAVAGTALSLGGGAWLALIMAIAVGVLWEWRGLALAMAPSAPGRAVWMVGGMLYIGVAAAMLLYLRHLGTDALLPIVCAVIATDVGAYFAGRTFGGPKIAPKVSPSKTWSGLVGGMAAASLTLGLFLWLRRGTLACDTADWHCLTNVGLAAVSLIAGALIAIIAQTGDFFESWMKRRAGVKDSGNLIPGHGGLFDRVDGLLAVLFVIGILTLAGTIAKP